MLGELLLEETGKTTSVRVLPDGKVEQTSQGSGKLYGVQHSSLFTGVSAVRPDGSILGEGNGVLTTKNGDSVSFRVAGVGWQTGTGWRSSYRGTSTHWTNSEKLGKINKVVGVWELESDEQGNYSLRIWEWK